MFEMFGWVVATPTPYTWYEASDESSDEDGLEVRAFEKCREILSDLLIPENNAHINAVGFGATVSIGMIVVRERGYVDRTVKVLESLGSWSAGSYACIFMRSTTPGEPTYGPFVCFCLSGGIVQEVQLEDLNTKLPAVP